MKIINPYQNIDFASCPTINAISHEHIFQEQMVKRAYDRGIRYFACSHYVPAVPRYPLSGWNQDYIDYVSKDDLRTEEKECQGSIVSFVDKDGNTVYTDDLPQTPNAEHPTFVRQLVVDTLKCNHFNVLGNYWGEVGWGELPGLGNNTDPTIDEFRRAHAFYDLSMISSLFSGSHLLYPNKCFGTINHCNNVEDALLLINAAPSIFQAMEVFNQALDANYNKEMRNTYDEILRLGFRMFCTAVTDWQGDRKEDPELDFDRGCNVLLIPNWNSMTVAEKSEAGLDAYIAGCYYPAGLGNHKIVSISVDESKGEVSLELDSNADEIRIVTNNSVHRTSGNRVDYKIRKGELYLRFECFFNDKDFVFTNPLWIEGNNDSGTAKKLLLID